MVAVTSIDVAREAGVSQATVSRVLYGNDRVSPQTRERVLAAMKKIGYSPNLVARAMKTHRTNTVGVVVSQITNPFYPEALQALGVALAEVNLRMVLWNSDGAGEEAAVESIRHGLVDGVLFTNGTTQTMSLRRAVEAGLPVVLLNRSVPDLRGDQVTSDNVEGGRLVARLLAELGHRRIGFIGGPPLPSTVNERKDGFLAELVERGCPLDPVLGRFGALSYRDGYAAMSELCSQASPPTAVFCVNDITAFGALDALRSAGIKVPDEVSVVGYDDVQQAAWAAFDLTTVRQPLRLMAARAVELLVERIADPERPAHHERYPAELIIRGTTARIC